MNKLYKNFWFDFGSATVALVLGIVMLPVFNIVTNVLDILLALTLAAYLVIFLFDKLRRTSGAIFVMTVIEFVIIALLAVGLVFHQFNIIAFSSVCQTIGVVLWLRGIVIVVGMYVAVFKDKRPQINLVRILFGLAIVTVGALLFASPIIADEILEWIIAISMFVYAVAFYALGILFLPRKEKAKNDK